MHFSPRLLFPFLTFPAALVAQTTLTVSFEDVATPPGLSSFAYISAANDGGLVYDGITWSSTFVVVGKDYVEAFQNNGGTHPFATPASGNYALFNASAADDLGFTNPASYVLTGAWFARPSLGVGANGTNQVTVRALAADDSLLGSVTFDLASTEPAFLNLTSFGGLVGIARYEIGRVALGYDPLSGGDPYGGGHYILDQLTFTSTAAVPEPSATAPLFAVTVLLTSIPRLRRP